VHQTILLHSEQTNQVHQINSSGQHTHNFILATDKEHELDMEVKWLEVCNREKDGLQNRVDAGETTSFFNAIAARN
jgi:hypothetical protein